MGVLNSLILRLVTNCYKMWITVENNVDNRNSDS